MALMEPIGDIIYSSDKLIFVLLEAEKLGYKCGPIEQIHSCGDNAGIKLIGEPEAVITSEKTEKGIKFYLRKVNPSETLE